MIKSTGWMEEFLFAVHETDVIHTSIPMFPVSRFKIVNAQYFALIYCYSLVILDNPWMHTEQILMIKSTGWIEELFHLRHVRAMSGMSGDTESSCDIPWAVIAFPLLGESVVPLSPLRLKMYRVSKKKLTRCFKSS